MDIQLVRATLAIIHLTISDVRDIFFYNLIGLGQKNRGADTIVEKERELLVLGPT